MCEPESIIDETKKDLLPKEYIAKVVYYVNFEDRDLIPDEHEVRIRLKNSLARGALAESDFDIVEIDLA